MNLKALLGSDPRTILMRKNMVVSALLKAWSALVFLALVPLTLKCLGTYNNGIWLTISSMLIWIDHLDIGLGNGLRNQLATHLAHGDRRGAQQVVTSTFFMLIMIIVPVALLTLGMIYVFDIFSFMNVDATLSPDLRHAVAVAVLFVCATFIFKFIGNFYMGLQLPAASNIILSAGHTLTLIATVVAWFMGCRSLVVIAAINTCSPLVIYLLAYPYTFYHRYPDLRPKANTFRWEATKSLFTLGVKFFVLQIAGVVLFMSSTLLVARLFTPEMVNPYQISYRYYTIMLIVFSIICTPIWSATTDAYARGDEQWIRNCRRRMDKVMLIMLGCLALMVALSAPIYHVWLQDQVEIPFTLNVLMAVYMFVIMYSLSYSNFLNGIGALSVQLLFTASAAVVFIPLTLLLHHLSDHINCVIITMIIVNLPGLVANHIQFYRIINHQAQGIWRR